MGGLKGKARARFNKKKNLKKHNDYFLRRKNLLSRIRKWHDPILKQKCQEVTESDDISNIAKEMRSVLFVSKTGVGLCASQLGYLKSIIAVHVNRESPDIDILINPVIIEKGPETITEYEGCLSYPGIFVPVSRSDKIKVKFLNEKREEVEKEYSGFESRIIQHEVDHIDGKCVVYDAWSGNMSEPMVQDPNSTESIDAIKDEDDKATSTA